jgi:hypothetical protein
VQANGTVEAGSTSHRAALILNCNKQRLGRNTRHEQTIIEFRPELESTLINLAQVRPNALIVNPDAFLQDHAFQIIAWAT